MASDPHRTHELQGRLVRDVEGRKLGVVTEVYLDAATEMPEWMLVKTGRFGRTVLMPLAGSAMGDEDVVWVPFPRYLARRAPAVAFDDELSQEDEAELYRHYGIDYSHAVSASGFAGEDGQEGDRAPRRRRRFRFRAPRPVARRVRRRSAPASAPTSEPEVASVGEVASEAEAPRVELAPVVKPEAEAPDAHGPDAELPVDEAAPEAEAAPPAPAPEPVAPEPVAPEAAQRATGPSGPAAPEPPVAAGTPTPDPLPSHFDVPVTVGAPPRTQLVAALRLQRGDRVLLVGYGGGAELAALQEAVGTEGRLTIVEMSATRTGLARRTAARQGWANVSVLEGSPETVELDDGFDAALLGFDHPALLSPAALAKVVGALRPGGRVVASGLRWGPWWLAPTAQAAALWTAWGSPLPADRLVRPWSRLEPLVPDLAVEEVSLGRGYLASGAVAE